MNHSVAKKISPGPTCVGSRGQEDGRGRESDGRHRDAPDPGEADQVRGRHALHLQDPRGRRADVLRGQGVDHAQRAPHHALQEEVPAQGFRHQDGSGEIFFKVFLGLGNLDIVFYRSATNG